MRNKKLLLVPGVAALAIGAVACGPSVTKSAAPPTPVAPSSAPALPNPPASSAPAPAPSSNSGPVGTEYTVSGTDESGNNTSYDVTAVKVDQNSALVPYDSLTNPADHLAAVEFKITGVSGQSEDDANSDATALGTDTTEYQSADNATPDGGNWNFGDFSVAAGQTASGWVTFELPPGQSVASVQWAPELSGSAATWTVGS